VVLVSGRAQGLLLPLLLQASARQGQQLVLVLMLLTLSVVVPACLESEEFQVAACMLHQAADRLNSWLAECESHLMCDCAAVMCDR
jgi:hypothetical protein